MEQWQCPGLRDQLKADRTRLMKVIQTTVFNRLVLRVNHTKRDFFIFVFETLDDFVS